MKIPKDDFYSYELPSPFQNLWHGWGAIGKHYCSVTTQRGMCDQETGGDCSRCIEFIRPVFVESTQPHVKKPWGFVTHGLRAAAGKFVDKYERPPVKPKTRWNEPDVQEDPFGAVLGEIDE
jgi:hypothetical protein